MCTSTRIPCSTERNRLISNNTTLVAVLVAEDVAGIGKRLRIPLACKAASLVLAVLHSSLGLIN